jgi:hypothetical protein
VDWEEIVAAATTAVVVALEVLRVRLGRGGRRAELKQDLEILSLLPEGSETRDHLKAHVDRVVMGLINDEAEKRRDPYGVFLGLVFLALGVWVGTLGSRLWLALAGFLALLGVLALWQNAIPRRRDERGRIIEEGRSAPNR